MIRCSVTVIVAVLWFGVSTGAPAQTTAQLRTADTLLRFSPGASGPLLVSLQSPGRKPWLNTSPEIPIDHVEANGRQFPLHWHFNGQLSSNDTHTVTFVYESASPHLRLTWTWRARAAYGPIEHQIHITNLDSRELWLPL